MATLNGGKRLKQPNSRREFIQSVVWRLASCTLIQELGNVVLTSSEMSPPLRLRFVMGILSERFVSIILTDLFTWSEL